MAHVATISNQLTKMYSEWLYTGKMNSEIAVSLRLLGQSEPSIIRDVLEGWWGKGKSDVISLPPDSVLFSKIEGPNVWTDSKQLTADCRRGRDVVTENACQNLQFGTGNTSSSLMLADYPITSPAEQYRGKECPVCALASASYLQTKTYWIDDSITMTIRDKWENENKQTEILPVHQWSQVASLFTDAALVWEKKADQLRDGSPISDEDCGGFPMEMTTLRLNLASRIERWQLLQRIANTPELCAAAQRVRTQQFLLVSSVAIPSVVDIIVSYAHDPVESMKFAVRPMYK